MPRERSEERPGAAARQCFFCERELEPRDRFCACGREQVCSSYGKACSPHRREFAKCASCGKRRPDLYDDKHPLPFFGFGLPAAIFGLFAGVIFTKDGLKDAAAFLFGCILFASLFAGWQYFVFRHTKASTRPKPSTLGAKITTEEERFKRIEDNYEDLLGVIKRSDEVSGKDQ